MPEYPDDLLQEIAAIKRRLDDLFSSAQQRPAITSASAGLILPERAAPPNTADAVHIYGGTDGRLHATSTVGDVALEPFPLNTPADAVANAANVTSGPAPISYSQSWAQLIYESVVDIKDQLNATLSELRQAGVISS